MPQEELFQADTLSRRWQKKLQGSRTKSADRPGRDFDRPDPAVVNAKFRVDRTMDESKRVYRGLQGIVNCALLRFRQPRWSYVDCFLEIGAFERIGLVEDRQDAQRAFREQSFDGYFLAGQIPFDKDLIEMRLASGANFRRFQKPLDARGGGEKFFAIVCANHSLASRKREGFEHARILHAQKGRLRNGRYGHLTKPRDR